MSSGAHWIDGRARCDVCLKPSRILEEVAPGRELCLPCAELADARIDELPSVGDLMERSIALIDGMRQVH